MKILGSTSTFVLTVLACATIATGSAAQSSPTEQDIIDILLGLSGNGAVGKGVTVTGEGDDVPAINLKVSFEFDSARLSNESIQTLDTLGRALSSNALKKQTIEIVGHTDATGTLEYNDGLSERRAGAVVDYLVRNFDVDPNLVSSKGMGERQLLDADNPESGVNRRVEIRNITQ